MLNQNVKTLINADGFLEAISTKTVFLTEEGKKLLGLSIEMPAEESSAPVEIAV
jgi:hypothetical protein